MQSITFFVAVLWMCRSHVTAQIQNPLKTKIFKTTREVHVREFAKIPDYAGGPSKIVGVVHYGKNLYVTTSSSGGLIYRVKPSGKVKLWFDVNSAMIDATGRPMSFANPQHGGLRGLAFHPRFHKNGLFYVSCMEDRKGLPPSMFTYLSTPKDPIGADSVVLEFRVDLQTGKPIASSYRQVLRVGMAKFDHPVKQIAFYEDNLYIAHGDGSVQSASVGGGQNDDGLGKILRINPKRSGSKPYAIPSSNPFVNRKKFKGEIWALGFRNPHNLCFGRTGELWVADAGRDNVEEINLVEAGRNYGWSRREGPFKHLEQGGILTGVAPLPGDDARYKLTYPVVAIGHEGVRGAAFVGQAIAASCPVENFSPLNGVLLYANFPTDGKVYLSFLGDMREAQTMGKPDRLTRAKTFRPRIFFDHDGDARTPGIEVANLRDIVRMEKGREGESRVNMRFGQGQDGELYWSSKANGKIYLITSSVPGAKI